MIDYTIIGVSQLSEMQQAAYEAWQRSNSDLVLLSPTGSGKTLAYLLPLLESLDCTSDKVQAVVIVPSRELAAQTVEVVKSLKTKVRSLACYGGRPTMQEHRQMESVHPHLVISTPGRLVDHLEKQNFEVSSVRTLVIDEFDKCLELGFHDEMKQALFCLPQVQRRILLSATETDQIPRFVNLSQAVRLDYQQSVPQNESKQERVSLKVVNSPIKDKLDTLLDLLRSLGEVQSIVFLNYREAVERVYQFLHKNGVACEQFHGGMEQDRRERALFKFSNGSSNVLVSTDLGSRGLDMPDTDVIIHYHLPLNEQAFIHRNGRTARWLATGRAFMILNEEERLPDYVGEAPTFYLPKQLPPVSQPKMATIYIGKGKKDKLSKMDIMGFLCKIGGLERSQVGHIDVQDHCSYAAVSLPEIKSVLRRVEGQKIKGIKTIFREAK